MATVVMPQLGESVTEGTVVRWYKHPGDPVELDEPLCEIETEKVNVELPSPYAGTMGEILVPEGETVPVGTTLCEILEAAPAPAAAATGREAPSTAAGHAPEPAAAPAEPAPARGERAAPERAPGSRRRFYSPAVLRLAALHGIDLEQVPGTGVGGRVTRKDVEAFIARREGERPAAEAPPAPAAAAAEAAPSGFEYEVVPLTPTRRTIAERLSRSAREIPQAWTMVEADVTELLRLRDRTAERLGRRLTLLPFFARAVCEALREHPALNARFEDGELRRYRDVHLGVAVAAPSGLVVPVLRRAQELSLEGLARALDDLVERARAGELRLEEVEGGTITVNNTGAFGSIASRPILNPPQVAIVTLERVVRRPVVVDGDAIAIRAMVNLCLTFDHRAIDGHEAGAFLATLKSRLEGAGPG